VTTAPGVIVVGGGYAGIAAAMTLADAGVAVTLLEERRMWGGRATSWADPKMAEPLDNGQHVWLGCYDRALALLGRLGTAHHVALDRGLDLAYRTHEGRAFRLRAPAALGRAGLALGLLGFGAVPLFERIALARALARGPAPDPAMTVSAWLDALRQGPAARRVFWEPLAEAALNLPADQAAATLLFAVITRAFRGSARAAAVGVPRAGLGALVAPVADALAARKGRAHLNAGVREVRVQDAGFALQLESGESIAAGGVVLAVPAAEARALVRDTFPDVAQRLAPAADTGVSPIVTLTLWYERQVLPAPVIGLIAPPTGAASGFHWAFDRGALLGARPGAWPVTLVASAASELMSLPTAAIVERACDALAAYGLTREAPIATRVVKEPRATPALTPQALAARPPVATGVPGLALAGDWTDTGLPATIEGAVVSGEAAARHLLDSGILPAGHPRNGSRT